MWYGLHKRKFDEFASDSIIEPPIVNDPDNAFSSKELWGQDDTYVLFGWCTEIEMYFSVNFDKMWYVIPMVMKVSFVFTIFHYHLKPSSLTVMNKNEFCEEKG